MTDQMTNRNKHVQPAPRPFNLLVRGGRLTRFKGQVASIAPGLLVVVTAAALLTGGVNQAAAQAAPEADACGAPTNGVVSCGAGTYADGIAYTGNLESGGYDGGPQENVHTLTLGDPAIPDSSTTVAGWGVTVDYGGDHDVSVQMDSGNVNPTRDVYFNHGVLAKTSGGGNVHAQMNGGSITASNAGAGSHGISARIENGTSDKTATATMTGGTITVADGGSEGVSAYTSGVGGNVTAEMSGNSKIITQRGDQGNPAGAVAATSHSRAYTGTVVARIIDNSEHRNQTEITAAGTGVRAVTRGAGGKAIASMVGGIINIDGGDAYGVAAEVNGTALDDSTAKVEARMTGGRITTNGTRAVGVRARTNKFGDAFVQMDETHHASTITTDGWHAHGLQAFSDGTHDDSAGVAEAVMKAGTIHTNGDGARGAYAQANGGLGKALVEMNNGSIRTTGHGSHGLYARIDKEGNAQEVKVKMTGGSIVTTNAPGDFFGSHGLHADTTGRGDVVVEMVGGTVTTSGRNSHGIWAESEARVGDALTGVRLDPNSTPQAKTIVNLHAGAVVMASGAGSDGIRVSGNYVTVDSDPNSEKFWLGVKEFDVDVAGIVTGGADGFDADDDGAAIRTISDADGGGTIDITDTAIVTAGGSGIAIQDGDGAANITSAGTITGDIRLGAGDDILTLAGGRVTGAIYGGAGNDTVIVSATTIYDGSYIEADQLRIEAGSVFRASGGASDTLTIAAAVTNNGILSVQDGTAGDEIRIEGDYTGSGTSLFALDTVLQGDGSNSDRVVITGDTSGEMRLSIASVGAAGAESAPLVMDVVSVGGEANGTFTLVDGNYVTPDGEHAVISGAHLYTLAEVEVEGGRGWALSALSESGETRYQPSAPVYDSYGQSLLALNGPKSLRNRGSSEDFRILAWEGGTGDQDSGSPLWLQMGADRITLSEEHSTTGAALESSLWEMEVGADIVMIESGAGLLVGGLMGSYAMGSTDVSSAFGDGSIDTTGLGVGMTVTWYDTRRFYVDGQMTLASYTSDLEADRIGTLTEGNSGTGYAVSLEAGQQLDLGSRLTVIPQAQLSLSSVAFSDFASEARGEQVTFEDASSQQLRLGVEFGLQEQEARRFYGIMNLFYEFGPGSEVDVTGAALTTESEPWAAGVGLGGTYVWNDRLDLFGETSYTTGLGNVGDTSALSVNAGFKVTF